MTTIIWPYNNAYSVPAPLKPILDRCASITCFMMPPISVLESSSSQSSREPIFHKCLTLQNRISMSMKGNPRRDLFFAPLVQRMHSTLAIFFPCVFAHEIGFNQDGLSFTSFEKGFGPAVQRRPWNLDRDPIISCTKPTH